MTRLELDEQHFASAALELAEVARRTLSDVLTQFGRIAVEQCIRFTPPHNYKVSATESGKSQKTLGISATKAGVNRAFKPWKKALDESPNRSARSLYAGISRVMAKGNWAKADDMLHRVMRIKGVGPAATKELHQSFRYRGRVPKNQWPFIVPNQISINKLIRYRTGNVGFAKSGWIPAAVALGSKLAGFSWIIGKGGESFGGISFPTEKDPSITIWNGVPYIQESGRETRIIERALESATIKMRGQIRAIAAYNLKKFGRLIP